MHFFVAATFLGHPVVLILLLIIMYLRSTTSLHFTLANMAIAKGHSSKTKSQVSDIRTIDSLVLVN